MISSKELQIRWVVGHDQASPESDRGRHHQGVHGQFASATNLGQQMAGDARYPESGCDYAGVPATELAVSRCIGPPAAVQLDQDCRGDPDGFASERRRAHGGTNQLVALGRPLTSGERG